VQVQLPLPYFISWCNLSVSLNRYRLRVDSSSFSLLGFKASGSDRPFIGWVFQPKHITWSHNKVKHTSGPNLLIWIGKYTCLIEWGFKSNG
jgi:hypothetical protein